MLIPTRLKNIFSNKKYFIKIEDIHLIKQIHHGYTNISYFVVLKNNKKLHVRIGNSSVTNRKNEWLFIKSYHQEKLYLYFNNKNGDYIREWINIPPPTHKDLASSLFIKQLCSAIDDLHKCVFSKKLLKHNYYEFIKYGKLEKDIKQQYYTLVNKYKSDKLVLSHNDLSIDNMLYDGNRITFIDFEWGRLNNPYWDIANFIRESGLNQKYFMLLKNNIESIRDFSMKKLIDFIFICTCYAYQWAYFMQPTPKIIKYRKLCKKRLIWAKNLLATANS